MHEDESDARASLSIRYHLPPGARQGRGSWWLIRLHYRVAVRPDAHAPAEFNVAGSVNESFFASTIWNLRRRPGGTLVLSSDDLGLVNGHTVRTSTKLVREKRELAKSGSIGVELTLEDAGPGIASIEQAMQAGYTTSGGLGLGLPGTKRLMDEFEIASEVGQGTRVTVRKWRRL